MFRILIVDDDPAVGSLLREVVQNLHPQPTLFVVSDGVEALEFLHRRGNFADVPLPHLILLDLNMPRLGGLETLSAIKSDPDLRVIPVIMFSTASSPENVRISYQAYANAFVQKPSDLERSVKLIQAIEAFWMDFAQLAADERAPARAASGGLGFAPNAWEMPARECFGPLLAGRAGEDGNQGVQHAGTKSAKEWTLRSGCEEHDRLLERFGEAVHELLRLHEQQYLAIVEGDEDSQRFDLLIHMATEKKQATKYDYLQHVGIHGCSQLECP